MARPYIVPEDISDKIDIIKQETGLTKKWLITYCLRLGIDEYNKDRVIKKQYVKPE